MAFGEYAPTGRIDGSNAAAAEAEVLALVETQGPDLLIDMSGLVFVSSAGLRVLLVAAKATRGRGGRTVLAGARPAVQEVLDMSGFGKIMVLVADRAAGVQALAAG